MKQCNIYEILQYIAKGGFIVFVSDTKKREIRLISHNGGERVGRISENTFRALLNSGISRLIELIFKVWYNLLYGGLTP